MIPNTQRRTLQSFVRRNAKAGSDALHGRSAGATREWRSSGTVLLPTRGQYVDGSTHANGIESFWAPVKRAHSGTFHKLSQKHLHRYVCEFVGHHNTRGFDTEDTMRLIVRGMVGRRLSWQDLTEEDGRS